MRIEGREQQIELGAARQEELDEILTLMCEAFEMPYAAARPIYYADPYLDPLNKRVLRRAGRVVSCLSFVETSCWIGRSVVALTGIAGLATRTKERNRGYAGRLLTDAVRALDARGCDLCALFAYSDDYYRRLGWESGGGVLRISGPLATLPSFAASPHLRAVGLEDIPALSYLYDSLSTGRTLHCLRDARRWRYLLSQNWKAVAYTPAAGRVEGYLLYDYRPGRAFSASTGVEGAPALRLLEMRASTPAARQALLGYLRACLSPSPLLPFSPSVVEGGVATGVNRFEYETDLDDLRASGLIDAADAKETVHIETAPGAMVRIINFERLLRSLRSNWTGFRGALILSLQDELNGAQSQTVIVAGDGSDEPNIQISSDSSFILQPSAFPHVEGDVRAWSRVVIGAMSGEDASALGLLRPSTPHANALLAQLFPLRTPFLPVPDHF